ncbi:MAG: ACT domain-containing protein [Firmicutes bacterium]|nr:ACT domain-containing protein [Bacillota bacterium]
MRISQISVFLENEAGRLANVAKILGGAEVNIRALSIADTADFGILRLIVDDPERAAAVLRGAGLTVSLTDVIAVEMPDRPGGLAQVLDALADARVNIEYMYAFVTQSAEGAVVVFRVDQLDEAIGALTARGLRLLSGDDVYYF